jgi:hypothetical protein
MFRPRGGVGSPYAWLHALMERVVVRDVVRRAVVGFLLGGCLIFAQSNAFATQSVSLAWDPSPDTNVVGYKVYYGVASRTYTNIVDVGDVTNTTISGLVEGTTYYFAVTAYNILGMESDFSAEVSYTVPVSTGTGNQPPTLNPIANLTINENAGLQTVNLTGITSGSSNEVQTLTVTAISSNIGLIPNPTVNYTSPGTNGTLTFTPVANANGSATITVTVNDGGASNNIVTQTFTVTVNAVNQPPTLNAISNLTINENAGLQTVNLTGVSSGAANQSQALTVTAVSSNTRLIPNPTVNYTSPNTSGTLTFTPVANANGSATVTVTVNNGGASNNIVTQTFTVTVNGVNQAPTLNAISNLTINENAGLQTVNLTGISSGAANQSQALTVTAVSSNTGLIPNPTVNYTSPNTNGTLTFTPVATANGSATVTVTVNNGGASNNIVTQTFTVTVNGVNQAPTLNAISNLTINENAGLQTVNLTGISSGATNEFQTLTITAASSNTGLIPNPTVNYTSPGTNGTLTFRPVVNVSGSATITVTVNDGGASNNTVSQPFTVTVNSPPTITSIANQTIATNASTGPIPFIIGDAETAAASLTLSAASSATTLIPANRISFGGSASNRTVTLTPLANQSGTGNITITVSDGMATASTTFQLSVLGHPAPPAGLIITTNGNGTVTPNLNSQKLTVGKTYTVTAAPAAGQVFAGWTGSYVSSNPRLTFLMASNLALQANFIPSPWIATAGTYSGLFYENDQVRLYRSGFFKVSSTPGGAYSGYLQLGAQRYSFSGKLGLQRQMAKSILRGKNSPLGLNLQIGDTNQSDQIFGQVTNELWAATLLGDRAVFNSRTNPAPFRGKYTLLVPGQSGDMSTPAGNGFGTVYVGPAGTALFAGRLADGAMVSQGAQVSKNGLWPLYAPLYLGNGSLLSWLAFTNQAGSDLNGSLSWIRSSNPKAHYYPGGFTNDFNINAVGSAYLPPVRTNILDLADAQLEFSGGDLANSFTNFLTLGLNSTVKSGSNHLAMTFVLSAGTYYGTVKDPSSGKTWPFRGAVLQKMNAGYGYLLGTNQSSSVVFEP